MVTESKEGSCSVHALRYLKTRWAGMHCLLRAPGGWRVGARDRRESHISPNKRRRKRLSGKR